VERWIEHLVEPERLIVEWRPPESVPDRARWAVGELRRDGAAATFRYFSDAELREANGGRDVDALRAAGFSGYPAFPWNVRKPEAVFTGGALEAFLRRLPSPKRSDFAEYLERFRLRPRLGFPAFALLAATGASLPGDGFSLIDPLDGEIRLQDVVLEVTGYRHYARQLTQPPHSGMRVALMPEPTSQYDPWAVRVELDGQVIGYVSRLQSRAVSRWLTRGVAEAWLLRVNGAATQPRAHILVEVRDRALQPTA